MIGHVRLPMVRRAGKTGERRLRWGSGLWRLMQDKSRKVRHGWGGRFFWGFHKVIFPSQGVRSRDWLVFNVLAQGPGLHGPR